MVWVKNIEDTSGNSDRSRTWLEHWEMYSFKPVVFCSQKNCTAHKGLVGAYVQKVGEDVDRYIIPLCKEHNATKLEFEVAEHTEFITTNKIDMEKEILKNHTIESD